MSTSEILLAGFGGQGVLFAGKFLANKGLLEGKNVSWLPSYGPEMRGGTANCSVIVSDNNIGSPIVNQPSVLIAMNLPSLDKYEDKVQAGGIIVYDSTLIERKLHRTDVTCVALPATKMASEAGVPTLSNMMLLGAFFKHNDALKMEGMEDCVKKVISARHQNMLEINLKAIQMGYDNA